MKILIFLPHLELGGAESVVVNLANYLVSNNCKVTLVTAKSGGELVSRLHQGVLLKDLKLKNQWFSMFFLPKIINKNKYDVVFSTLKESNAILALSAKCAFSRSLVVIREANTISKQAKAEVGFKKSIKNILIKYAYNFSDYIISLSSSIKDDLINYAKLDSNRIVVIENPLDIERLKQLSAESLPIDFNLLKGVEIPVFSIVARLRPQKNHVFLFQALKHYKLLYGEFKLYVLGDGELFEELSSLAIELNLESNIIFTGLVNNPFPYVKHSDVFILPSLYEGFSNAMIEAAGLNTKILASDSQETSMMFIKSHNCGRGYDADNVQSFTSELNELLNEKNHDEFSTSVIGRHDSMHVFKKYVEVFNQKL